MSTRPSPLPLFLTMTAAAIVLAGVLIALRYQLEVARTRVELTGTLTQVAESLNDELTQGEAALAAPRIPPRAPWHSWRLSPAGFVYAKGDEPPIAEESLRRLLTDHALPTGTVLLGPLATPLGRNVVVLTHPRTAPGADESGVWSFLDDMFSQSATRALLQKGSRLQLFDDSSGLALFQTGEGELTAPISTALRVGETRLHLRASNVNALNAPLRTLSSSLLILLLLSAWLAYEWRRGSALVNAQGALAELEARRQNLNLLYGKSLQDLFSVESRLQLVTMHDSVTGLANRTAAIKRIEAHLDLLRQASQGSVRVLAIGFEHLNDISSSLGANFASRVLLIAAERIDFLLGSKELLFRIGDFNLALILPGQSETSSEQLAEKIVEEIGAPISVDSHTVMLHPSVGIAETNSGYEYAESLLTNAHSALMLIDREAPRRHRRFDATAAQESVSRLQLEADLARAFDEQQLLLEYEPFIEPQNRAIAGFEALVRWNHPTEGKLSPARFIPIALQAGWANRLNNWVLREAIRQAAKWRRAGHTQLFVNCNLTAEALLRPRLAEEIADLLAEFELPGQQLVIELTESTLIQDPRGAARMVQRMSELGVGTWLDDFGTGYSSLSHLRALPLKGVKIDRSFIERIEVDSRDFGFLKGLLDLVSYLGLQSIAEGIETAAQFELLRMTNCELFQGYYFSTSMSADEAEKRLQAGLEPSRVRQAS
jgi:diguanylate cyclase (GGDEF)-like protein